VLTFLNAIVHQFYYYGMSPFLSQIGLADRYILPAMSMGQFGEVFVLALLGVCLAKLGIKRALIIGVLAQAARCLAFASGRTPLVLAVIPLHGICYACFFTVAYIYVDSHSSPENRAGAQQLFTILISGIGYLVGNLFAGKVAQLFTVPGTTRIDFALFWIVSAGLALLVATALTLLFREEQPLGQTATETPNPLRQS
jgi:MFS family permease